MSTPSTSEPLPPEPGAPQPTRTEPVNHPSSVLLGRLVIIGFALLLLIYFVPMFISLLG